jgi:serine-type D-Ala-D-Ala carboxypeptidase/endopeptidase (penicillin-binding protein 4)
LSVKYPLENASRFKLHASSSKNASSFKLHASSSKNASSFKPRASRLKLHASCLLLLFNFTQAFAQQDPLKQLLDSKELSTAFVGVYVYDDSSKKVIADYQSERYFVPASCTKLFTLYAGMKYLQDSLPGITYRQDDTALLVGVMGDPTFLHPDFPSQPVMDFLKKSDKKIYLISPYNQWRETPLGKGWAWDDYNDDYSVERSQFPIYGNFIRWNQQNSAFRSNPAFEPAATVSSSPEISWKVRFAKDSLSKTFLVQRLMDSNVFVIRMGTESDISQDVPFITNDMNSAAQLLSDTLGKKVGIMIGTKPYRGGWTIYPPGNRPEFGEIYSRPVDSLFKPMMYNSDNFFAEQTLLMVSNNEFRVMNDDSIINMLLNGPLANLPQKPSWVDGSGLSRYNLFSPQDFVDLLIKFKNEFGMDRMKRILPTGGTGTLKNYYRDDNGSVFAKTGSMSGVHCISGYIYTDHKQLLEFSILVNNSNGGGTAIRREVENYIEYLRKNN